MITVPPHVRRAIEVHAEAAYPEEACGFLIGTQAGEERTVTEIQQAPNEFEGVRRTRFLIQAREVMSLEQRLEDSPQRLLGFYHSHPDHPARPSEYDRAHAWPWFSYIVVAVTKGKAAESTSWRLRDDASLFEPEPILGK